MDKETRRTYNQAIVDLVAIDDKREALDRQEEQLMAQVRAIQKAQRTQG